MTQRSTPVTATEEPKPAPKPKRKSEVMRADGNTTANGLEIISITNCPKG